MHPDLAPKLKDLAKDWSSGALTGKPSQAWVTPGASNGLTGAAAFETTWNRFFADTYSGQHTTLGTIFHDAKEQGWLPEDFELIDGPAADDPEDAQLRQARETITALIATVKDGDFSAPLEAGNVDAFAQLQGHSKAEYQRARAQIKQANKQVSLVAIDTAVKARLAETNTAPTHHGYATALIESLTVDGWAPVGHEGSLYVVDPTSALWVRKETSQLERLVAEEHDGKENCTRSSDYSGIARHAVSLVSSEAFFAAADVGMACPGGFYRIVGDETKVEPLTPAHRQRVLIEVTPTDKETPLFTAFLHETFKSPNEEEEVQQCNLVQEIAGAIMLGLMHRHQKAVQFYDPYGRAGKGTLESILRQLVPASFVTAVSPFAWHKEYFVVGLAGARLNVVGELPDNESIPAAIFKSVIGGDLITGRNPTHRPISFKNEAAHVFMSNHLINSRDQSEAFFARWLLVEFPNSRLRSGLPLDPMLADRISGQELPGIAHWALEGAKRLLRNNAFSKSMAHDRLMAKWRRSNSSLEEFIHDACDLGVDLRERRADLYRRYADWCGDNGRKPFSKARVKELLEHNIGLGITLASLNGHEIFRGVQLRTDDEDHFSYWKG